MKKFSKIGKRVLAFFLVALMNINSYAAVGANDGSAFVTKAEFDALVNTFNEQMDSYESSLVTKVDGAIANYLAGLSSSATYTQNIILNSLSKYSFTNNWKLWDGDDKSELGNKLKFDIYISCMLCGIGSANDSHALEWTAYINNGSKGSKTSNYVLVNPSEYDKNLYTIAGRMKSTMVSSAKGQFSNGAFTGTFSGSVSKFTPTDLYDTNNSGTFGSTNMNLSGNMFGHSQSITTTVSYTNEDAIEANLPVINYLSGGTMQVTNVYMVETTKINNKKATDRSNKGSANNGWVKCQNGNSFVYNNNNPYRGDYQVTGYYHDYTEFAQGYAGFVLDDISSTVNTPTYYYSGLPVFKATTDGDAKFIFKLNGAADAKHNFEMRADQFDNNAITPGLSQLQNASSSYVDSAGNVIKNVCSNIPSGCEVTVDFKAKKDTTYWIKAIPTKGQTSIVGTSASIYVE